MTDPEAKEKPPLVRLIQRVRADDRRGGVPRPDVGDASGDDQSLACPQQQRSVRQRLAVGAFFAEPRHSEAELLNPGDGVTLLIRLLQSDQPEPDAGSTDALAQRSGSLL
jgi:hypothetical protein